MPTLNYKHLRYFWAVAKSGAIARASEQLHLTPQSISGQLRELEENLGVELFRRAGRGLELTDAGQNILAYADQIFSLGDQLLDVVRDHANRQSTPFSIGIADSVPKSIVYRLIEPALQLSQPVRLICREGRLTALLADLSIHKLDLVIADRAMPNNLNVIGFSHLLGESHLTVFGKTNLIEQLDGPFPQQLNHAPFLLPGADSAIASKLKQWFSNHHLSPRIVGEFDDSALLNAFGQAGAGFFVAPSAIAPYICKQHDVRIVGEIGSIHEQLYAISNERRITHPATIAISQAARDTLFVQKTNNETNLRSLLSAPAVAVAEDSDN